TADITVGYAWLPAYNADPRGTNVIITRTREMDEMVNEGQCSGELALQSLTPDLMAQSQAGGLRHRRLGLALRLFWKDEEGRWRPPKRVAPQSGRGLRYAQVQRLRIALREASKIAFE